jgi:hypothetical protein
MQNPFNRPRRFERWRVAALVVATAVPMALLFSSSPASGSLVQSRPTAPKPTIVLSMGGGPTPQGGTGRSAVFRRMAIPS